MRNPKNKTPLNMILAEGSKDVEKLITAAAIPVEIVASEGEGKLPSFSLLAYNGGLMSVGWWGPVALELSGMRLPAEGKLPVIVDHNRAHDKIVGHATAVIESGKIKINGEFSAATPARDHVLESAKNGYPWQCSIGAMPGKYAFVKAGESAMVNGKKLQGPFYHFLTSTLKETSFVTIGADEKTQVNVAAEAGFYNKENDMKKRFIKWLEACGLNHAELSPEQLASLQAQFDAMEALEAKAKEAEGAQATGPVVPVQATEDEGNKVADEIKAERERVANIEAACAGDWFGDSELKSQVETIRAEAVRKGESAESVNAKLVKLTKENFGGGFTQVKVEATGGAQINNLEAALVMAGGSMDDKQLVEAYGAKILDAADKFRHIGAKDLIRICCQSSGVNVPGINAKAEDWIRAAFSTTNFGSLLSNTASKTMMSAYRRVPTAATRLAKILSAKDFKTHTGHALTANNIMQKVGADGELKHGSLGDRDFSYSVETYGRILGLTRQDIINDDLGAFLEIPSLIGQGAAMLVDKVFWDTVIASTWFTTANGNLIEGTASALSGTDSIAALSAAIKAMEEMTDDDGNIILIEGKYLVVPPALKGYAQDLYNDTKVEITGSTSKTRTAGNRHAGSFEPISVPRLKADSDAWYLWADPSLTPAYGLAFLNGRQGPVVEEVAPQGAYLGQTWRGYIDVGACEIEKRGVIKNTGVVASS